MCSGFLPGAREMPSMMNSRRVTVVSHTSQVSAIAGTTPGSGDTVERKPAIGELFIDETTEDFGIHDDGLSVMPRTSQIHPGLNARPSVNPKVQGAGPATITIALAAVSNSDQTSCVGAPRVRSRH